MNICAGYSFLQTTLVDNILVGWKGRGGADYYILTSHFLSAPGLNSKTCEGMHGGEKLEGHKVDPIQHVPTGRM